MSNSSDTIQMNVSLPARLVEDLQHYVSPPEMDGFVAQALERELHRLRLEGALELSAGAWKDGDHPELNDGVAIDRWIAEGRRSLQWDRLSET